MEMHGTPIGMHGKNPNAKVIHLDLTGPEFALVSVAVGDIATRTPHDLLMNAYGREMATLTYKNAVALLKGHQAGFYEVDGVEELEELIKMIEDSSDTLDLLALQEEASSMLIAAATAAGLAEDPRVVGH